MSRDVRGAEAALPPGDPPGIFVSSACLQLINVLSM